MKTKTLHLLTWLVFIVALVLIVVNGEKRLHKIDVRLKTLRQEMDHLSPSAFEEDFGHKLYIPSERKVK